MFALDCPKWKEQHGCEGGPVRNVCKKTCDLCGKPHKDNLFYQILKKIHEYSILSPILQRMIINDKPKPQCETPNCCKTGEYFDEYDDEYHCERVCCDEENTLGPEEHCNKLDDHEFHCSMMNRITGQWTPTTLTQSLDDVIRCECEWTGVLVDPQYDK